MPNSHGTSAVFGDESIDGYPVGAWATRQRHRYTGGRLSEEYADRLEGLPGWIWSVRDANWENGFQALVDYIQTNGNASVPARCVFRGYQLGTWVNTQRSRYAKNALDPERVERLGSLPEWSWDAREEAWIDGYRRLEKYAAAHGTSRVPRPTVVDGFKLGQWVGVQRANFAKGELSQERIARLEKLSGWSWEVKSGLWEDGFRRLIEYLDHHGGTYPVQTYAEPDGYQLGAWVTTQRADYSKQRLTRERVEKLQVLKGWTWNSRDTKWEFGFQRLTDYMRQSPNASLPPQSYVDSDGYKLGSWVITQRNNRDKGTLTLERQKRLEAIRGWSWEPLTEAWEKHFQDLLDYVDESGTSRVHQTCVFNGFHLGAWVQKQRNAYRVGKLTEDQKKRLEALAEWKWGRADNGYTYKTT